MANRREEERERLRETRREREAERDQATRRRLVIGYSVAVLVGLVLVGAVVYVVTSSGGSSGGGAHIELSSGATNGVQPDEREGVAPAPVKVANLKKAAKEAGCVLRLRLKDEGHTHIPVTAPTPHYKTNPPTSGPHVEAPYQQADGAYAEMPAEIDFVHSLEHGRTEIQYSPSLPNRVQLELKGLYDTMYGGSLLFPNTNMPYEVAATAWRNLMGCDKYRGPITLDAIRDFGKATWGKYGGESPTPFGILGPTPVKPES
ncbi:MAG: DUF3105 domain-containing protein [Solirubrobacterales bacterium]